MPVTAIQEHLVAANKAYASNFTKGHLALPPAKKYAVRSCPPLLTSSHLFIISLHFSSHKIVTCMDARIDPAAAYGIELGDAHVIRNAGGNARDALRSLVISEQLLGTTEIIVVKHTGCGMLTFKNEDAEGIVAKNLGEEAVKELSRFEHEFQPFLDLEQAVKDDISFLKTSKLIPDTINISGFVYAVETGKVTPVV
jgi:carbonic anhydrase